MWLMKVTKTTILLKGGLYASKLNFGLNLAFKASILILIGGIAGIKIDGRGCGGLKESRSFIERH